MQTLLDLFDRYGAFKRAVRAAADDPVSPSPGNGQDTAPPPPFDDPEAVAARLAGKGKGKPKRVKSAVELPDASAPAPDLPQPLGETDITEECIVKDTVIGADGAIISTQSAPSIRFRQLPKSKFFRTWGGEGNTLVVYTVKLEKEDTRPGEIDRFFLTGKMAKYFREELNYPVSMSTVRYAQIYQGQVFLFAAKASTDLSDNTWNSSMRDLLLKSETMWVRKTSDRENQEYGDFEAQGNVNKAKPRWATAPKSLLPIRKAFAIAARKTLIADLDHPISRRLRGEDGTENLDLSNVYEGDEENGD
jgi:hypothetical protein